jgi:hypothetical protein
MQSFADQQVIEQAAAAGFKIGDYAHHPRRDHRAAMVIENFELHDGVLMGVLMFRCVITPLTSLRLSTGHKRPAEFAPAYEFVAAGPQLATVLREAEAADFHLTGAYTGAMVRGAGSGSPEVWLTSEPEPTAPSTVFCLLSNAPWQHDLDPEPTPAAL